MKSKLTRAETDYALNSERTLRALSGKHIHVFDAECYRNELKAERSAFRNVIFKILASDLAQMLYLKFQ